MWHLSNSHHREGSKLAVVIEVSAVKRLNFNIYENSILGNQKSDCYMDVAVAFSSNAFMVYKSTVSIFCLKPFK